MPTRYAVLAATLGMATVLAASALAQSGASSKRKPTTPPPTVALPAPPTPQPTPAIALRPHAWKCRYAYKSIELVAPLNPYPQWKRPAFSVGQQQSPNVWLSGNPEIRIAARWYDFAVTKERAFDTADLRTDLLPNGLAIHSWETKNGQKVEKIEGYDFTSTDGDDDIKDEFSDVGYSKPGKQSPSPLSPPAPADFYQALQSGNGERMFEVSKPVIFGGMRILGVSAKGYPEALKRAINKASKASKAKPTESDYKPC